MMRSVRSIAPVLTDAGTDSASLAFMAIALVSAVGVLLWQRWSWLAVAAFLVSAPQLGVWLYDEHDERRRRTGAHGCIERLSRVVVAAWAGATLAHRDRNHERRRRGR